MTLTTQTIAAFLSLYAVWFLYERQGVCPHCQGRGRHLSDCPQAERSDSKGDDR